MSKIPKIGHFLNRNTFTEIILLINLYSMKKYNNQKLNYKHYKEIIGKTMYQIFKKYKNELTKKEAIQKVIIIVKEILDKEMENKYFENEDKEENINLLQLNRPLVDKDVVINEELKIKPVYEQRFNKILENNREYNNQINKDIIIKKEYNEDIQKNFIFEKEEEFPIDLEKNPRQYREELIISPDDYIKNLQKQIIYEDIIIDSRDRNIDVNPQPNNYEIDLEKYLYNIISLELISADIPNTEYIINSDNNLLHFEETNNTELIATIPIGNYSLTTLSNAIQTQLNIVGSSTYSVSTNDYNRISEIFSENTSRITSNAPDPYKLFNNDINTFWLSSSLPAFFIYDFQKPEVLKRYRFICTEANGRPLDWVVEISDDKSNWITIDTRTGETTTLNVYKTITLTNSLASRYVRFRITNSTNSTDVHISEMEFYNIAMNKITITSDLTGGSNIFNLNFFGGTQKTNHLGNGVENIYKDNSIAEIIGFDPLDLNGFNNYTSNNEIILELEKKVFLEIFGIDNIELPEQRKTNLFCMLTLDSNKGEYSYIKNLRRDDNEEHIENEYIYHSQTPFSLQKLKIKFKKSTNKLYNFYGLEHNIHFRIKRFNFKNDLVNLI